VANEGNILEKLAFLVLAALSPGDYQVKVVDVGNPNKVLKDPRAVGVNQGGYAR
jgi:hypothetical protein